MSEKIYNDKYIKCPKCKNNALWTETRNPSNQTLICLSCGYYHTGNIEFILKLTDVNEFRANFELEPLEKLIKLKGHESINSKNFKS
jgi:transcription elongation factor Elf1